MFGLKVPALKRLLLMCCGCTLAVTVAGCGKGDPKLVQVEGKVTVGSKPLTTGTVTFYPDATKGNQSKEVPLGAIDAEGNYRLITRINEGVTPGWYNVAVTAAEQIDPKNPYFTDWLIPQKYIDPKKSNLRFEVVQNPLPGAYDIKLEPKSK